MRKVHKHGESIRLKYIPVDERNNGCKHVACGVSQCNREHTSVIIDSSIERRSKQCLEIVAAILEDELVQIKVPHVDTDTNIGEVVERTTFAVFQDALRNEFLPVNCQTLMVTFLDNQSTRLSARRLSLRDQLLTLLLYQQQVSDMIHAQSSKRMHCFVHAQIRYFHSTGVQPTQDMSQGCLTYTRCLRSVVGP